jgi:hypothetical protein
VSVYVFHPSWANKKVFPRSTPICHTPDERAEITRITRHTILPVSGKILVQKQKMSSEISANVTEIDTSYELPVLQ